MAENLSAFTASTGTYPPYISINRNEDGTVTVIIRSAPKVGVFAGQATVFAGSEANITLTEAEFLRLLDETNHELDRHLHA